VVKVEWDALRRKIRDTQYDLGRTEAVKKYRTERDKDMVPMIRNQAETRRKAQTDEQLRKLIGQEYQDLADVAYIVYTEAMDSIKK